MVPSPMFLKLTATGLTLAEEIQHNSSLETKSVTVYQSIQHVLLSHFFQTILNLPVAAGNSASFSLGFLTTVLCIQYT